MVKSRSQNSNSDFEEDPTVARTTCRPRGDHRIALLVRLGKAPVHVKINPALFETKVRSSRRSLKSFLTWSSWKKLTSVLIVIPGPGLPRLGSLDETIAKRSPLGSQEKSVTVSDTQII